MPVERPNFATASVEDMKRYLRDCWQNAETKGIEDAERELIRRGHKDYVDLCRSRAPR